MVTGGLAPGAWDQVSLDGGPAVGMMTLGGSENTQVLASPEAEVSPWPAAYGWGAEVWAAVGAVGSGPTLALEGHGNRVLTRRPSWGRTVVTSRDPVSLAREQDPRCDPGLGISPPSSRPRVMTQQGGLPETGPGHHPVLPTGAQAFRPLGDRRDGFLDIRTWSLFSA